MYNANNQKEQLKEFNLKQYPWIATGNEKEDVFNIGHGTPNSMFTFKGFRDSTMQWGNTASQWLHHNGMIFLSMLSSPCLTCIQSLTVRAKAPTGAQEEGKLDLRLSVCLSVCPCTLCIQAL